MATRQNPLAYHKSGRGIFVRNIFCAPIYNNLVTKATIYLWTIYNVGGSLYNRTINK